MARRGDTYYYDKRRSPKEKGERRRRTILDYLAFVVTVIVAAAILVCWASRWINPEIYGTLGASGLLMPVVYVLNLLCLLYWAVRWKKAVFVPLVLFIATSLGVTLFFKPSLTQDYTDHSADRSLISITSYNVRGMMERDDRGMRLTSSMDNVISALDSLKPAILCMQEFQSTGDFPEEYFDRAVPLLRYKTHRYIIKRDARRGWGLAIYSRYPIVRRGHLDFENSNNAVIWSDIAINQDTVRVFNAHLQTTSISAADRDFIENLAFATDSTSTSKVKKMVGKLKDNYVIRGGQADSLAASIASSPYPVIVCGDFNDTPVSYAYRKVSRGLKDSFREAGRGYGYTYRGFFNLLRIDYILHSRQMECVEYASPDFDYSDHNPVSVKIRLRKNR